MGEIIEGGSLAGMTPFAPAVTDRRSCVGANMDV